jgi:hypothetical protein
MKSQSGGFDHPLGRLTATARNRIAMPPVGMIASSGNDGAPSIGLRKLTARDNITN